MHERIKPDGTVVAAGSGYAAAEAKLKSAKKRAPAAPKDDESNGEPEPKSEPAKPEPAKAEGTPLPKSEPPKPASK